MEEKLAYAFVYSEPNGREVFKVTDVNENLPIPNSGETVKLDCKRYVIQTVKIVESRKHDSEAKQCRISVMLLVPRLILSNHVLSDQV
jgi:hypothetical protein